MPAASRSRRRFTRARHCGRYRLLAVPPRGHMEKGQTFEVRIMLQNEKTGILPAVKRK
jgi:hypothetical protein